MNACSYIITCVYICIFEQRSTFNSIHHHHLMKHYCFPLIAQFSSCLAFNVMSFKQYR